jgi:biofilm PGA synthesis N-glycosyltransferase PgaC
MLLAVVVPFLDERPVLEETLNALSAQTRFPDRLILADDGSTDGSTEIAAAFARDHEGVELRRRPPRPAGPDRLATASELVAFQEAAATLGDWDVLAKLDADLRLPPTALGEMLERMDADPRWGIAGTFLTEVGTGRLHIGPDHVHGATKFYRRGCWEQIAPLPAILGWDTIDEMRARRAGWRTGSIALRDGDPVHLRPRGAHDGLNRAQRRWGRCAYAYGEPGPLVAGESLLMLPRSPRVVGGLGYAWGWLHAALTRAPRAEPELRRWVRRERYGRVARRLRRA